MISRTGTGLAADGALVGPQADAVFTALADSTRRRILQALVDRPDDAGSLGREFGITRQATAKHLRILEDAGFVSASHAPGSRRRLHTADPRRIREISDLLGAVARGWERRLETIAARAEHRQHHDPSDQDT